jgi:hypothetical protein
MTQRVNWVLDLDMAGWFGWLRHRIADPRVLRLIERWLKAGILESGRWEPVEVGTPQGSGISPLLANVSSHYVVDLWVHQWWQAQGDHGRSDSGAHRSALDPSPVLRPQALGSGRLPRTAEDEPPALPRRVRVRFNRRRTRHAAFVTLLGIGARTAPAPYHMLIRRTAQQSCS